MTLEHLASSLVLWGPRYLGGSRTSQWRLCTSNLKRSKLAGYVASLELLLMLLTLGSFSSPIQIKVITWIDSSRAGRYLKNLQNLNISRCKYPHNADLMHITYPVVMVAIWRSESSDIVGQITSRQSQSCPRPRKECTVKHESRFPFSSLYGHLQGDETPPAESRTVGSNPYWLSREWTKNNGVRTRSFSLPHKWY